MRTAHSHTVAMALKQKVNNLYVNLTVAVILFVTGFADGWDSLQEDMRNFHLRAHHGVMVYGFFGMLKSIPDIFEGFEKMDQGNLVSK
ncbi:MAG: hypothetical protein ACREJU_07595 [Nitrospiraceae bacterium]